MIPAEICTCKLIEVPLGIIPCILPLIFPSEILQITPRAIFQEFIKTFFQTYFIKIKKNV